MAYYTNTKIDGVNYMAAADLEAIETGFAAVEADIIDLSGITDAPTALANLGLTATAAEINTLDGITSTVAELNILDGVTSTTAELNILDGITSTVTELNLLDGLTTVATLEANTFTGNQTISSAAAGAIFTAAAASGQTANFLLYEDGSQMASLAYLGGSDVLTLTNSTSTAYINMPDASSTVDFISTNLHHNGTEVATRGINTFIGNQVIQKDTNTAWLTIKSASYGAIMKMQTGSATRIQLEAAYLVDVNALSTYNQAGVRTNRIYFNPDGTINVNIGTLQQGGEDVAHSAGTTGSDTTATGHIVVTLNGIDYKLLTSGTA